MVPVRNVLGHIFFLASSRRFQNHRKCEIATQSASCVIFAHAAAKLSATPRFGSASPFVVFTGKVEVADERDDTHTKSRLSKLFRDYGDVFCSLCFV